MCIGVLESIWFLFFPHLFFDFWNEKRRNCSVVPCVFFSFTSSVFVCVSSQIVYSPPCFPSASSGQHFHCRNTKKVFYFAFARITRNNVSVRNKTRRRTIRIGRRPSPSTDKRILDFMKKVKCVQMTNINTKDEGPNENRIFAEHEQWQQRRRRVDRRRENHCFKLKQEKYVIPLLNSMELM